MLTTQVSIQFSTIVSKTNRGIKNDKKERACIYVGDIKTEKAQKKDWNGTLARNLNTTST